MSDSETNCENEKQYYGVPDDEETLCTPIDAALSQRNMSMRQFDEAYIQSKRRQETALIEQGQFSSAQNLQPDYAEDEQEAEAAQQNGRKRKRGGTKSVVEGYLSNRVTETDVSFMDKSVEYKQVQFKFPFELECIFQHTLESLTEYPVIDIIHQYMRLLLPSTHRECANFQLIFPNDDAANADFMDFEENDFIQQKTLADIDQDIFPDDVASSLIPYAPLVLYGLNPFNVEEYEAQLHVIDDEFLNARRKMLQMHINSIQWSLYTQNLWDNVNVVRHAPSNSLYLTSECLKHIVDVVSEGYRIVHTSKSSYAFRKHQVHKTEIITLESHVNYSPYQYAFINVCDLLIRHNHRLNTDGMICSEIVNENNQPTFHWQEHMTIRAFISQRVTITENPKLWSIVKGPIQTRLEREFELRNEQTPVLYVRRGTFSFENGVFDANTLTFYRFDDPAETASLYTLPPPKRSHLKRDDYEPNHPANQPFTSIERMCTSKYFSSIQFGENAWFPTEYLDRFNELSELLNKAYEANQTRAQMNMFQHDKQEEIAALCEIEKEMFSKCMISPCEFRQNLFERLQVAPPNSPYYKWYHQMTSYHKWSFHSDIKNPKSCDMGHHCEFNRSKVIPEIVNSDQIRSQMDFFKWGQLHEEDRMNPEMWGYMPCFFLELNTPMFDKIWADQGIPPGIAAMALVMIGRVLFEIGDYDDWQCTFFLEGLAGTGKSTVLLVLDMLFNPKRVASMTSSARKDFWGSNMLHSDLAIFPDVGEDWGANNFAQMQSMISGERTQVEEKQKTAHNLAKWGCHMVFAGNVFPKTKDLANALVRRFIIFLFNEIVGDCIPGFDKALISEIPIIMLKASLMYKWALTYFGSSALYRNPLLPYYFQVTMKRLKTKINPVFDFITDGKKSRLIRLIRFAQPRTKIISKHHSIYLFNTKSLSQNSGIIPRQSLDTWNLSEFLAKCSVQNFLVRAYIELALHIDTNQNLKEFKDAYKQIPSIFVVPSVPTEIMDACNITDDCHIYDNPMTWKKPNIDSILNVNPLMDLWKIAAKLHTTTVRDEYLFKKKFFDILNFAFQYTCTHNIHSPLKLKQHVFYYLFNGFCTSLETFNENYVSWAKQRNMSISDSARSGLLRAKDTHTVELFKRLKVEMVTLDKLGYDKKNDNPTVYILGMSMCNYKGLRSNSNNQTHNNWNNVDDSGSSNALKPFLLDDYLGSNPCAYGRNTDEDSDIIPLNLFDFPPKLSVLQQTCCTNCK